MEVLLRNSVYDYVLQIEDFLPEEAFDDFEPLQDGGWDCLVLKKLDESAVMDGDHLVMVLYDIQNILEVTHGKGGVAQYPNIIDRLQEILKPHIPWLFRRKNLETCEQIFNKEKTSFKARAFLNQVVLTATEILFKKLFLLKNEWNQHH